MPEFVQVAYPVKRLYFFSQMSYMCPRDGLDALEGSPCHLHSAQKSMDSMMPQFPQPMGKKDFKQKHSYI